MGNTDTKNEWNRKGSKQGTDSGLEILAGGSGSAAYRLLPAFFFISTSTAHTLRAPFCGCLILFCCRFRFCLRRRRIQALRGMATRSG